ncbi:immunoglobulin-like domain-containing protein [Paenibacillus harenae]|uniref:immunoglobulin-like domain-containing protein n=1 Tax=Paenibacillus harenae TaxID=306543 RepID=UPI0003F91B14|nr:immunoglobulin-like domain-containing protein [Paenibacillus harenae]
MGKRLVYSAVLAVLMAGSAVGVYSGASPKESIMATEVASEDGFDVQRDIYRLEELIRKHFPDKRIYKSYKGPSLEEYGVFYIDNDNNQYVFLSDKDDAKAGHFKRDLERKLDGHIEIKDSKYPYLKLRGIQDEIVKNYDSISVGVEVIGQVVKVQADWTEAEKKEVLRKYGDAVSVELYDPGAIAPDGDSHIPNLPEPVQQVGGPNDKVFWPPNTNRFLDEAASAALEDEVYMKTGFPRFDGKLLDKYGLYTKLDSDDLPLPEGDLVFGINRLPKGMKTRISVTEINKSLKPVHEISNATFENAHGMRVEFPDRRNVMYGHRLELLNDAGEVVDGKVTVYAFSTDEINAIMEADKPTYRQADTLKIKLTNWGPTALEFGSWFGVQKWDSGRWKWLNGGQAFTDELRGVGPGGVYEDDFSIESLSLEPGKYRIVKSFGAANGDASASLAAPFEIIP